MVCRGAQIDRLYYYCGGVYYVCVEEDERWRRNWAARRVAPRSFLALPHSLSGRVCVRACACVLRCEGERRWERRRGTWVRACGVRVRVGDSANYLRVWRVRWRV